MGCLIVIGDSDKVAGIIRERDYVDKVFLLGLDSRHIAVENIYQPGPEMVVAKCSDSVFECAQKLIDSNARHLPVIENDTREFCGLISGTDLVREFIHAKDIICMKLNEGVK